MGTPDFAVPTLRYLIEQKQEIVAVYSQPPRPSGRGHKLQPSPVHQLAEQHGIPVYTPTSLKSPEVQAEFATHKADAAIVAAYGLLLPVPILETFPMGCLNVHPSKLPRWRGAAPLQRTIMAGDTTTAMIIMQMAAGLDTGDILWEKDVAITEGTTAGELHDQMANLAGSAVLQTLRDLRKGNVTPHPQSTEGITYAHKITKEECAIDWRKPAAEIRQQILGLSPYPAASFEYQGEKIKVLDATLDSRLCGNDAGEVVDNSLTITCGDGHCIRPTLVQRAGKKPMSTEEMLRGFTIPKGATLT